MRRLVLILVLSLGVGLWHGLPAPAWAQAPNQSVGGATLPSGPIGPGVGTNLSTCGPGVCCMCGLFAALERLAPTYTQRIYAGLATSLGARILPDIVLVTFCLLLLRLFLDPGRQMEHAKAFASHIILVTFVVSIMGGAGAVSSGGTLWVYDWVFGALQQAGILAAELAIQLGASGAAAVVGYGGGVQFPTTITLVGGGGTVGPGSYSHLWAEVETVCLPIITITMTELTRGILGVLSFNWLPYLILSVPYVFVMGIFAAFLVQTQFYFIAIGAAAPVLIVLFLWEKTRSFLFSALKFLVGGAMTVMFSGVAMGFTGFVLFSYLSQIQPTGRGTFFEGLFTSLSNALTFTVAQPGATAFTMASAAYWMIFILGFLSALLHLAAPRIASNVSGAQDSATSAAAVTAAAQFAGAKAIGYGYRVPRALVGGAAGMVQSGAAAIRERFQKSIDG